MIRLCGNFRAVSGQSSHLGDVTGLGAQARLSLSAKIRFFETSLQLTTPITVIQHTRRLTFRRLTPADASFIMAMEADQDVMRHTTGCIEPSEARRVELLSAFALTRAAGFGHWCVEGKIRPIGWVSLTPLEATGRIQLAYRFVREAWGQGFATEAGEATLEYARTALGLAECVAIVWPANTASSRVLSKLGFQNEGRANYHGREVDVLARSFSTTSA